MNFLEILQANGITDELAVKITSEMKENKIYLANEENLDVRYNKLKLESEADKSELLKAQTLISELQNGNKENEELQTKLKEHQDEIATLRKSLDEQKVESALERELIEANVQDVDYVKFKLKEKGVVLKLNENGKLENFKTTLDEIKIQIPNQFKSSEKKVEELKLPNDVKTDKGVTKDDYYKMPYAERVKLFSNDKQTFDEVSN